MSQQFPEKNLMVNHYLEELLVLSTEIIRTLNEIDTIVQSHTPGMDGVIQLPNDPKKYFFVQPDVFSRIATIMLHSANIKKILFAAPRKKEEAKIKFEYRVKRSQEIQQYFDMNNFQEIKNSGVRNSLEHYDEKLDAISLKLWNGEIPKKYHIIATNTILSTEGALYGFPYYLKCYVMDSRIYKNAEKEADIGKIAAEASYITEVLKTELQSDSMSGSVIIIPPRN